MSVRYEAFLRRYATSPIHVPRLERLLATYAPGGLDAQEAFAAMFIAWDDACGDGDAARIVTEVISQVSDGNGRLIRLTDEAVRGAITWIADSHGSERVHRATALTAIFAELTPATVVG